MVKPPQLDVLRAVGDELGPLVLERVVRVVRPVRVPARAVDVRERVALAALADGHQAREDALLELRRRALPRPRELVQRLVRLRPVEHVHGVVQVVRDHHQPLPVGGEAQADHRGRALERKLRHLSSDRARLRVHPRVPHAHDRGAGRGPHLAGRDQVHLRVHRHALDVVIVPVEEVLLVDVPVEHDPDRRGVVHGVVRRVVKQIVRRVGQAAVPVHPLQAQTLLGRFRAPRGQGGVPRRRRVHAAAAREIFDAPVERVLLSVAGAVGAEPAVLLRDDAVAALERRDDEHVHGHAPGVILAVLGEERVD